MRLAGTCSRYSNSATPQLASAATYQGRAESSLRCAYQAKVMNTFEATSKSAVRGRTEDSMGPSCRGRAGRTTRARLARRAAATHPAPHARLRAGRARAVARARGARGALARRDAARGVRG